MIRCFIFCAVMLGIIGTTPLVQGRTSEPQDDMETVIGDNSEFAFDLYAKLKDDPAVTKAGGNLFFSPYSISTALAMTWSGAGGETEKQMAEVLHFTLPQAQLHKAFGTLEKQLNEAGQEGRYELSVANALWGQAGYNFLDEFLELTEKNYGAGLREVDFVTQTEKSRQIINAWVEEKTKEKIKDLIQPGVLNALTRLVLTNAIYFKGDWAIQFDKKQTKDAPFNLSKDKQVPAPMMNIKERFKYRADDKLQVLQLPYKGEELSMIILLPNQIDGLADMEKSLTIEKLNEWSESLRKQEVIVYLPKFKITTDFELSEYLKKMGMPDAFSLPPADFSGITGDKSLYISNVIHKAFVAVDEEGTEAAAATSVTMRLTSVPAPPKVFRADHPFIFIIKDNRSQSILFMGRVMNPEKQDE
jgi:serine protease inhibitor